MKMFLAVLGSLLALATTANTENVICSASYDPALVIPDLGAVIANVTCPQQECRPIEDVTFKFNIVHTYSDDLTMSVFKDMQHERFIKLTDETPCTPDSWVDVIIDEAGTGGYVGTFCTNNDLTSPPSYTPKENFTVFHGLSTCGEWNFKLQDLLSGDTGSVTSIEVTMVAGEGEATTAETTPTTPMNTDETQAETQTTDDGEEVRMVCGRKDYNQSIPDFGTVVANLKCPGCITVDDINVRLNLVHSYSTDLVIALRHNGITSRLKIKNGPCQTNDYVDVIVDDQGELPLNSACPSDRVVRSPPDYTPVDNLAIFRGQETCGEDWVLTISDDVFGDFGWLLGAELLIRPLTVVESTVPITEETTTPEFTGTTPPDVIITGFA